MRRLGLALVVAALGTVAAPAAVASAEEPLECKIVNGVSQRVLGEPILICLDDPNDPPSPW